MSVRWGTLYLIGYKNVFYALFKEHRGRCCFAFIPELRTWMPRAADIWGAEPIGLPACAGALFFVPLHYTTQRLVFVMMDHTSDLITILEKQYGSRHMLRYRLSSGKWQQDTGAQVAAQARLAAQGLAMYGIKPGECVGIYSQNRPEYFYVELGLFAMRAVSVPLYATCSPDQVYFISHNASVKLIFVGGQFEYNNTLYVKRTQGQIEHIVILDPTVVKAPGDTDSVYYNEFVNLGNAMPYETQVKSEKGYALPHETAVIIYTSGTSGTPKGVQITHRMICRQMENHKETIHCISSHEVSVNFLPLSHVFEKMWCFFCFYMGMKVVVVTNPKEIMQLMPQIRPTFMCNVPRYWEKVYHGVREHIHNAPKFMARIYKRGIQVGERYRFEYDNPGRKAPLGLRISHFFYSHTAFYVLKRVLGLQRGKFYPTAGAPLNSEVNRFLQAAGFNIVVGYGLSESTATVSFYPQYHIDFDSIGEVLPGVEVRIDPQTSEILLRGETITPGYYQNPEENAKAFTPDGWFRTGDAGRLDGRTLYYTERIKDLFKTSNGKYIAPQQIENMLSASPFFEQAAVIADGFKYVSALLFPNYTRLRALLKDQGKEQLTTLTDEQLAQNDVARELLMAQVEQVQSPLAAFEKIKVITLLAQPFSVEDGTLTNTLKLKRKNIYDRYKEEIAAMYGA